MAKFLAVITLATALVYVSADGLIGAPAAVYGPPVIGAVGVIRTVEPIPLGSVAVFPPKVLPPPIVITETVPHHVPVPHVIPVPTPVVTPVIREAVPVPVHIHSVHHAVHHAVHHTVLHPVAPVVEAPLAAPYPAHVVPAPVYGLPAL